MTKGKGLLNPAFQFNLIDTDMASQGTKDDGMKKIKK